MIAKGWTLMRIASAVVSLAAVALLAGCGAQTLAPTAPVNASATMAARADEVETGEISFDKQIVYHTVDLLGVGSVYQTKLEAAGLKTVNSLLSAGASRSGRDKLAKDTGISEKLILTWVNHADLMRVTGCGPEYARLLERAGVDTTTELCTRRPANLALELKAANDLGGGKVCTHRLPNLTTTEAWVANARNFTRIVTY
jgi:predicted flap endonuclease-1-like 5' DNA nuclease